MARNKNSKPDTAEDKTEGKVETFESVEEAPSIGDPFVPQVVRQPVVPSNEDYERFTQAANRSHGHGPDVAVGIGTLTYDLPVVSGLFRVDAPELDDLLLIPCRTNVEGQYTSTEVKELLAEQIDRINKDR